MAQDIMRVIGIARLTRDAELKYLGSGTAVLKFSIAVNSRKKQGDEWVDEASFYDCVLYGKGGESVNQYMTKGKQVAIDGRLHQARWESEGQTRSKVEIVIENVQLLGGKSEGHADAPPPSTPPRAPAMASAPPEFVDDMPDPQIPF